jgi:hypothetical protein
MVSLSIANLIGNFLFGAIGFVAFVYGKRLHVWKLMLGGLALMIFPYFVADTLLMYLIGTTATATLFLRNN